MQDKRSYKTLEFWLSLAAMVFGALLASGAITDDTILKIIGAVVSCLNAMGFVGFRVHQKSNEVKAAALVEAVKAGAKPPDPS